MSGAAVPGGVASTLLVRLRPMVEASAAGGSAPAAAPPASASASAPGGSLDIPLDTTPAQLEALVNAQVGGAGEARPYALYLNGAEVTGSLRAALAAQGLSAEAAHTLHYQPLALFRVAPVSRCADSLPGHGAPILHISFIPCWAVLASGGGDGAVRFWDARTATPRSRRSSRT